MVIWVLLGVVLEQVEAAAKPLLVPMLKTTPRSNKTTTRTTNTKNIHSGHSVVYSETFSGIFGGYFRGCSVPFGVYPGVILKSVGRD